MVIALLAGGTGGAKLAAGLRDELAARGGELHVIANTGDDIEIYGVHVSPDPDLISFRLAGALDARGFGVAGESHDEMDRRRGAGEEIWFELGDGDFAVCRARAGALARGATQTAAHHEATADYDTGAAIVLPMCDEPVRTLVDTPLGPRGLQEFLIRDRSEPDILGVRFDGIEKAAPTAEVLAAIESADAIVIGPSNPAISIGPILAVPGMRAAISMAPAPVLAVSPYVGGEILKGPTAKFMAAAAVAAGTAGVAEFYGDLVDEWIADEAAGDRSTLLTDVRMDGAPAQRRVAAAVLERVTELSQTAARR